MNGVSGPAGNAHKPVEVGFRLILERNFKTTSLEETHVKEKQPAKENATLTSAQVWTYFINELKLVGIKIKSKHKHI